MACWNGSWLSHELPGSGDATATWAADTLLEAGVSGDALYVATPDGGAREALAFWAAAGETGYAFAAPAAFPWTLATSPTGRISQRLGITGPCTTYVGGEEAYAEALAAAEDDVRRGLVSRAVVVRLRGDRPVAAAGGPVRQLLDVRVL